MLYFDTHPTSQSFVFPMTYLEIESNVLWRGARLIWARRRTSLPLHFHRKSGRWPPSPVARKISCIVTFTVWGIFLATGLRSPSLTNFARGEVKGLAWRTAGWSANSRRTLATWQRKQQGGFRKSCRVPSNRAGFIQLF